MRAFIPVLIAVLSVLLVSGTGYTERRFFGTALEDYFFGLFLPLVSPVSVRGDLRGRADHRRGGRA